jgi:Big-like domain-containing protein/uncharacterized protein DUF1565
MQAVTRLLRGLWPVLALALVTFAATAATSPAGLAASSCSLFASVDGSDSNSGSVSSPFRTAQTLVDSLGPGGTGCLTGGGTFVGNVTFSAGGSSGAPVTLMSDPGSSRATVNGVVYVTPSASFVTLDDLRIDATNVSQVVAVQLFGDYGKLTDSEVFGADQDRIGVQIGYQRTVAGVEVAYNRIHDFGIPSSIYDHGIYIDLSDGAQVHDNYIYDDAGGYGIQLWTHSMNGHIYRNTIDGNGQGSMIIAGQQNANGGPSSNNEIDHNIFSNPVSGKNIAVFWSGGAAGSGNSVHDNVYWGGGFDSATGVAYSNNLAADPQYTNRPAKDFTLTTGSPATGYGVAAPAPPPPPQVAPSGSSSILAGASLSGTVSWTVTANVPVATVEFSANGTTVATVAGSPATTSLDTTSLPNGTATLGFTLVLADGTRYPTTVGTVTIANPPTNTPPPIVSSIQEGAILTGVVHWTATAPAGTRSVEFWVDGLRLQTLTTGPYAYELDTTKLADGAHIVGVAWTDSAGVRHPASPATDVTIQNAVRSSIKAGDVLKGIVHWNASASVAVQSVEFWIDGVKVATDPSPPYRYDLDTRRYANGAHIVGVAWTDAGGTRHPAAPQSVTVAN